MAHNPQSQQESSALDSEAEFSNLLLVVESSESAACAKGDGHGSPASGLDDARNGRAKQRDTVTQSQLGTVVLVLLDQVACTSRSILWIARLDRTRKETYRQPHTKHRVRVRRRARAWTWFSHSPLCLQRPLLQRLAWDLVLAIDSQWYSQRPAKVKEGCSAMVTVLNLL